MDSRSEWNADKSAELGIIVHNGREYSALGATITPNYLACYPHADGTVKSWDGATLGPYKVLSSRPAVFFGRYSWQGDRYYFMRAIVRDRTYSIRGFGVGMLARGRAVNLKRRARI
jgi:hypothetical protein